MKRMFLILLVMTLILISAAVQGAANAFPGGEEKFLGLIPMWDLRLDIPCGVFAAGELMVAMGVGAQLMLSAQRAGGKATPQTERHMQQLVYCSLWCGWTVIACCTTGLGYIIPGAGTPKAYDLSVYSYFNVAGAVTMLACYVLNAYCRGRLLGAIPGILALVLGVAAGHMWHGSYTDFHLLACFMALAGFSVRRLAAHWPQDKSWILPGVLGAALGIGYSLHLYTGSGRTVDTGLVVTLLVTLALSAGLSVLRLAK